MGKGGQVCGDILLCILAIILPPLAVLIKRGCGKHFCLNIVLTILLWLPGVIHAWYVILTMPPNPKMYGIPEQGTGYGGVMGVPPSKAQKGYYAQQQGAYAPGQGGYVPGQGRYVPGQGGYAPGYGATGMQTGTGPATATGYPSTYSTTAQPYGYGAPTGTQGYVADRFYTGNVVGAQQVPVGVPDPAFQKPKGMTW